MTIVEVLKNMRSLISDPMCWIKGDFAIDYKDRPVDSQDDNACGWCLVGALRYFCSGEWDTIGGKVGVVLDNHVYHKYGHETLAKFNDDETTDHNEVMIMLDELITQIEDNASDARNQ